MDEENLKVNIKNLKPASPTDNENTRLLQNKQLPLKNNPLEMVQEGKTHWLRSK